MSELTVYETWLERSGHIETVVTDAPGSMRLVDADGYDKLQAERDRVWEALEKIANMHEREYSTAYDATELARAALQEVSKL